MDFKHVYDRTGSCKKEGNESVELFKKIAFSKGYFIENVSLKEDTQNHVDLIIFNKCEELKVQVKGRKKLFRYDKGFANEMTCLELHGSHPNGKDRGWLWGAADVIAFRYGQEFLVVDREMLRDWIYPKVNMEDVKLSTKNKIPYEVYVRPEHPMERFTYVYFKDIMEDLKYELWN